MSEAPPFLQESETVLMELLEKVMVSLEWKAHLVFTFKLSLGRPKKNSSWPAVGFPL